MELDSESRKFIGRSLGGKIMASRQRQDALKKYYSSPSICIFCKQTIMVPDGIKIATIRCKKFCNRSCSASFYNSHRKIHRFCRCGEQLSGRKIKCSNCLSVSSMNALSRLKASTNKTQISEHARRLVPKGPCSNCGYSMFTEVCHIKAISSFPEDATIGEVNRRSNLVRLCPNCHWELDHGSLKGRFQ
jgi:5-methylcytosine-specific restriction endonuclease McrA